MVLDLRQSEIGQNNLFLAKKYPFTEPYALVIIFFVFFDSKNLRNIFWYFFSLRYGHKKLKTKKHVFWSIGHNLRDRDLKIYFWGFFGMLYKVVRVPERFTWGQISPSYPATPFNNLGIFQSLKFRILMEKILPISLKLNFIASSLGCYGLS